jgi:hypothetical protein
MEEREKLEAFAKVVQNALKVSGIHAEEIGVVERGYGEGGGVFYGLSVLLEDGTAYSIDVQRDHELEECV